MSRENYKQGNILTRMESKDGQQMLSLVVKRPWLCQRNADEFNHAEISEKTGWKLRIRKSTTKPSNTIKAINYQLKISSSEKIGRAHV